MCSTCDIGAPRPARRRPATAVRHTRTSELVASAADGLQDGSGTVDGEAIADGAVRVGDIPMTFVTDVIDLFGAYDPGCTSSIGQAAPGAVADNQSVVTQVVLADGGANPGWFVEGLVSDTADVARYRVCNYTGARADAPPLRFTLFTIGL